MASTGPLNPTSVGNMYYGSGFGQVGWTSPQNAVLSDGVYSTVSLDGPSEFSTSAFLVAHGFGFSVPENAIIDGVTMDVEIRSSREWRVNVTGFALYVHEGSYSDSNIIGTLINPLIIGVATSDTYYTEEGPWGTSLTPAIINSPNFGGCFRVALSGNNSNAVVYCDHIRMTVHYHIPNQPPEITVPPSVNYNGYTRLGPNNATATVSFTATDADGDALTYEIRTAVSGGGTLVKSGSANEGSPTNVNIAHNASGINEGSNTLYLRVNDGTEWSTDSSFTLLVDRTAPSISGSIVVDPEIVTGEN